MGNFFTSVQILLGPRSSDESRRDVAAAVRSILLATGFTEITVSSEVPDRTVLVGLPGAGGWVGVYDQGTGDQDLVALTALAKTLSARLHAFTLAILVHDSDVLELRLCRDGRLVDSYSSDPGYWEEETRRKKRPRGRHERWRSVLAGGVTANDLHLAWQSDDVFAEDTLRRVAPLLGLDPAACCVGFDALQDQASEPSSTYITLKFKGGVLPPEPRPIRVPLGAPPRLVAGTVHGGRVVCAVGDVFDHEFHFHAVSAGGISQGLEVWIQGSTIGDAIIAPTQVETLIGHETKMVVQVGAHDRRTADTFIVTMPGAVVPHAPDPDTPRDVRGKEMHPGPNGMTYTMTSTRLNPAWAASLVNVRMIGTAARVGQGNLALALVPTSNTLAGAATVTYDVEVTVAARRPLNCLPPSPSVTRYLRQMEEPETLVGLVALGANHSLAVRAAIGAMEEWNSIISEDETIKYETVFMPNHEEVKGGRLSSKQIPSGPSWRKLAASLEASVEFQAHYGRWLRPGSHFDMNPGSGFMFRARSTFLERLPAELIVYVGLWFDCSRSAEEADSAQARLREIVDELMVSGWGIQAFMARWAWSPRDLEHTPYEMACGVNGICTTGRTWTTRYLRAVSDTVWLGPELLARLGDRGPLAALTETHSLGPAVRFTRRPSASLDNLERALSALLPDQQDWTAENDRIYGRPRRDERDN